jgi:hypothetical protein
MTPRGVARSHHFDYRSSPTGHSGRCLVPCPKVTSRLMQRYFAPEGEASAPQGDSETPLGAPLLNHGPTAHYWGSPQTPRRPDGSREALRRPPVRSPSGRPGGRLKCSVSVRPSVDRPHRRRRCVSGRRQTGGQTRGHPQESHRPQIENMVPNVKSRVASNAFRPSRRALFRAPRLSRPNVAKMEAHGAVSS